MNIVLLSGGSGKRLWPLSNDVRSKQFIRVLKNDEGQYESMAQRVFRQIRLIDKEANIIIATSSSQETIIKGQLDGFQKISIEPSRRDTFPAIVLASAYLVDVLNVSPDDAVVFCPVDPYCDCDFFLKIKMLYEHVLESKTNISLIGIKPSYASTKYGYIMPKDHNLISEVMRFKEKPSEEVASKYIDEGALWNAGVFGFKLSYVLKKANELFGMYKYQELFDNYEMLNKTSFDYAVLEKERLIDVLKYDGEWRDIGTWDSLTDIISDNIIGEGIMADDCQNVNIINELDVPIIALGLKDTVIAASGDGILVSDKEKSSLLKQYADKIDQMPMIEEHDWGIDKIIEKKKDNNGFVVKHQIIKSGKETLQVLNILSKVIIIVVEGTGIIILNSESHLIQKGTILVIEKNDSYSIKANSELHIIRIVI